jgi:transposase
LVSPLKRTWAPRRQTPVIRTSLEHNARLNLIGALGISPGRRQIRFRLQSHPKPIRGDEVVRFLRLLANRIRGPIALVWDRHPIHGRRQVKEWLAQHPRFHVYEFPTSAPELNPTEWVWTQIKESTASTAPRNAAELRANVCAGVARTRRSQSRLWACIFGSGLPWER